MAHAFGVCLLMLLMLSTVAPLEAQRAMDEDQVKEIVHVLKALVNKARAERSADPWLLQALNDVIQRYDWPWHRELLSDSFADGDYARQPSWQVAAGEFWVEREGLRTRFRPPTPSQTAPSQGKRDAGSVLVGTILNQILKQQQTDPSPATPTPVPTRGEIYLPLAITNAFALKMSIRIHNAPSDVGRLESLIYHGAERTSGYRLNLNTGPQAGLELERIQSGFSAVIDAVQLQGKMDGGRHTLEWRRDGAGSMQVLLDGQAVIQTRDRRFQKPFDGIALVNRGGDYNIKSISLHGVE